MLLFSVAVVALVPSRRVHSRSKVAALAGVVAKMPDEQSPGYVTTSSGLKLQEHLEGIGRSVILGDVVTIRLSATSLGGFMRSVGVGVPQQPWEMGSRTETFLIGGGQSELMEEAVVGMRVGGSRAVLVPPSARTKLVPRNSKGRELQVPVGDTIRYTTELVAVRTGAWALAVRIGLLGTGSIVPGLAIIALANVASYLLFGNSMPPPPADAATVEEARVALGRVGSGCSSTLLLDARTQLDLAVQASSVQAWPEAAEVADDPLLKTERLRAALDACSDSSAYKEEVTGRVEELTALLHTLGAKTSGAANEEAMRAMRLGTSARSAFDALLSRSGIE